MTAEDSLQLPSARDLAQDVPESIDELSSDVGEDDDDEDDETESEEKIKPQPLPSKRTVDQVEFAQWVRQKQKRMNEQSLAESTDPFGKGTFQPEDIQRIVSGRLPADKQIISSPREYQVELFERAKEKNTIVVLPTGTGKTLIAALLTRHVIEQELIDRASKEFGNKPRISFFLVDKISLVHQQWKVLRANLAYNIAKFHGEMIGSALTQDFWKQQLEENMAIVCTAEILRQCLSHGYFGMDQINLIVFDEAHHAKKNHPYAMIIKDFYLELEKNCQRRPRILGMTASPVDAKTDLAVGAAQLEALLQAEIATVDDPSLMRASCSEDGTALERVAEYWLAPEDFTTPLWQKLHSLIGRNAMFRKLFSYARASTKELGRWCADRIFYICLTTQELAKAKAKTERNLMTLRSETLVSSIDVQTALIDNVGQLLSEQEPPEVSQSSHYLSNKVETLLEILREYFQPASDKCIIFVEQRLTGVVLADLLNQPSLRLHGLTAGTLLGAGPQDIGSSQSMSNYEQQRAIQKFHTGDLNVLITTTIGEEGLDIPDCNMVVRFDLYHTMIQYIQSKGRARMKDSKYFHMVERGGEQVQKVFDSQDKEAVLHSLCLALPGDRLLKGNDFDMEFFLRQEKNKRVYKVPTTGAKLTYESSLVVLATYVASLADRPEVALRADYIVRSVGTEFQSEVILPDNSPVKSAVGRRARSKQAAKCSAAFEACLKLRKCNELDEYLQSTRKKRLPAMRNAQLALSSKKRAEYNMKIKPDIWNDRGLPERLHVMVLRLESPESMGRPSRPLLLLTRKPLPQVAKFPIFFGNQQTSMVECYPLSQEIPVSVHQIESLTDFTLRIFKDVYSKGYKSEPEKLPYFLAPSTQDHASSALTRIQDASKMIDWKCIDMLQARSELESENQPESFWLDRYVTDPHDGSRKFYTRKLRGDLKPTDPQIANAKGLGEQRKRRNAAKDIWNYSISMWSKSRSHLEVRDDLPVIEAEFIPLRRNLLDEYEKSDYEGNVCYICFATLKISALPVDVVAMAYTLPAIIHRLESNLIVLEAVQGLGLQIRPELALEAMTKDSDNSDEHYAEQVNFQKGMGNNYERLEFLGDSFLKMSTSIALYTMSPEDSEFDYHVDRMVLICNKNLFNNALELKLEESIRSKSFNRRTWYPDGLEQLSGKLNHSILGRKGAGRGVHVLGDKSIADVCEALIGAAYLTGREGNSFDLAVKAVTTLSNFKLQNKNHTMMAYGEFFSAYEVPKWQSAKPTAVHLDLADKIEKKLGYKFEYPRLLRCAFIHSSYGFIYEHIPSYQRLEFLGDSLLDMVCVDYLFHRYPGADPQWLTEHKMAMVSNQFLGCLCVALDLHRHLMCMTAEMPHMVGTYVQEITSAQEAAEEEAVHAHQARSSYSRNFWTSVREPPKCLPDIVEAYIGAVFVDSKYDYSQVEAFFRNHVEPYFEDMHLYDTFANKHPVTFLGNKLHLTYGCADWRVMVSEMPADTPGGSPGETQVVGVVMIHGAVRAHAMSASGRYAKVGAANRCLALLADMSVDEYKASFSCQCKPEDVAGSDTSKHATAV